MTQSCQDNKGSISVSISENQIQNEMKEESFAVTALSGVLGTYGIMLF